MNYLIEQNIVTDEAGIVTEDIKLFLIKSAGLFRRVKLNITDAADVGGLNLEGCMIKVPSYHDKCVAGFLQGLKTDEELEVFIDKDKLEAFSKSNFVFFNMKSFDLKVKIRYVYPEKKMNFFYFKLLSKYFK